MAFRKTSLIDMSEFLWPLKYLFIKYYYLDYFSASLQTSDKIISIK